MHACKPSQYRTAPVIYCAALQVYVGMKDVESARILHLRHCMHIIVHVPTAQLPGVPRTAMLSKADYKVIYETQTSAYECLITNCCFYLFS